MRKREYQSEEYQDYIPRIFKKDRNEPNEKYSVKNITFQVTDDCSLRCKYCYQNNKGHSRMSFETAKEYVDLLLSGEKGFREYLGEPYAVVLDFIGGEPLLEPVLIDKIIQYFRVRAVQVGSPLALRHRINICSNGVAYFDPDVQILLKKYENDISLNITIDGNKELHDSCRVFPDGVTGSYDLAVTAMQDWVARGHFIGSKITLAPGNIMYAKDAIIHMVDLGYDVIHANTVYEKGWEPHHATEFYYQLKGIADYMINNHCVEDIYCSLFEDDYFHPVSTEDNQNWCGGSGLMLACDPKGDLFSCIRFMESSINGRQEPLCIGNTKNGIGHNSKCKSCLHCLDDITRRSQSTDECYHCPIGQGCGWCSGYNYEEFGTVNKRAVYICEMHKARSLANVYFWNKYYQNIGMDKTFPMHCPKEWALQIINEKEYEDLLTLSV